ncbi:hypothetical protein VTI74DRAFT_8381 [Chaetomium olivicolor]
MASHLFTALPNELLVFVIEKLDRVQDIAALALTNRRLHSVANSHLYRRAAECNDVRPLAWAADRGLVSTMKMALAAGIDPDHQFVEYLPRVEWERASKAAAADAPAGRPKQPWAMWDYDNDGRRRTSLKEAEVSPVPADDSDQAGTPASTSVANQTAHSTVNSDGESVASLGEEPNISPHSAVTPATEPSFPPVPDTVWRTYHAIHLAARGGHDDIIRLLHSHGATIEAHSARFCACTPLYGLLNALESPRPDADQPFWTPLHVAICHAHPSTAKLLLALNHSPMKMQSTPCRGDWHASRGSSTALHHAAAWGLSSLVSHLLDHNKVLLPGYGVNTPDAYSLPPLYHAIAHRRWSTTVPLLLSRGADIDAAVALYIPYSAITPLGEACRLGHFGVADRLIALGADVTKGFIGTRPSSLAAAAGGGCLTPLHMCCMRSAVAPGTAREENVDDEARGRARMRTIERLIRGGAELDVRDCFGSTPAMAAVHNSNTFALEALSLAGVETDGIEGSRKGTGVNQPATAASQV